MPASEQLVCERKFVSCNADPQGAIALLQAMTRPDGHYPVGSLESVYFDDAGLSSYYEKANGDALKRKVRIRWYRPPAGGGPEGPTDAFLEIKDRIGAARDKCRVRFQADGALLDRAPLDDPVWDEILRGACASAGLELPAGLLPTVSIRYSRHRFVCPLTGARISIDYDIAAPRANGAVFPFAAPLSCPAVVCEAKHHSARAWPWSADLAAQGYACTSFSKYGYFIAKLLSGDLS